MSGAGKSALTVDQALARVLTDVPVITDSDRIDVAAAAGRVLAADLAANLTQPPFDASAMDGYAVRSADVATLPATLTVIGEAAAGRGFAGIVTSGTATRIFTGAPVPAGADGIVIQENTERDGNRVTVRAGRPDPEHIRPRGGDFHDGAVLLQAGKVLGARDLLLAAGMGHAQVPVRRRPRVALIATGDELVLPGTAPGPDQIVCSNPVGVGIMLQAFGAHTEFLGIARDTPQSLSALLDRAKTADVVITLGGASVGDHDLVGPVLGTRGMALDFWKIAMRPGKPLMFGRLGQQRVLGLPGNPVSSMITARIFAAPLILALQGRLADAPPLRDAPTTVAIEANGARTHYMRAIIGRDSAGRECVTPIANQDSSLVSPLATANALIVRPIGASAVTAQAIVQVLSLDF